MNVALIIAGGSGSRTEQSVPKQFISIFEKPIVIYALEAFQAHPEIDAILVSCLDGWQSVLRSYAGEYGITKLKWVVTGGENGHASIRNGLFELEKHYQEDDIVLIHDGVRPMVSPEIISDAIAKAKEYGSGLAALRCYETLMKTDNREWGNESVDRDSILRIQTPQAYRLGLALWAHKEATKRGITNSVTLNNLLVELGETLYFSLGSAKNIKITTVEDIDMFKAIYSTEQENWLRRK